MIFGTLVNVGNKLKAYVSRVIKAVIKGAGEAVKSISELEAAFKRAKESDKTYVISMKTDGYEWLEGTAFWESPTLEVDNTEGKKSALNEFLEGKNKQRKGV